MKPRHQRLLFLLICAALAAIAVTFILKAFEENLVYFYSPQDIAEKQLNEHQKIRVGGLVVQGTIESIGKDTIRFKITDTKKELAIEFTGIPPALFREGQGVIAEGVLKKDSVFYASQILAKHDENYMPPEVAEALKKNGHWKDNYKKQTP